MIISIQLPENSVERVDNSVITNLYNAHINGNISDEINENNLNIGLVGSITADGGYESLVSTLNSAYPKFHCTITKSYIEFRDPNVFAALRNQGIGDSFGITTSDVNGLKLNNGTQGGITFRENTDIEYFEEFKYFTNTTDGNGGPFYKCTNLKLIALPETLLVGGDGYFTDVYCDVIVPSVKWLMEWRGGRRDCLPHLGNQYDYYVGDINHELLDLVVTSDITNIPQDEALSSRFAGSGLRTITWESSSNIPTGLFKDTNNITTLTVTGNITSIGREAFRISKALTSVTLPLSCTSFGEQAFISCNLLQTFIAPGLSVGTPVTISNSCFLGCRSLTTLDLSNVTSLGLNAFTDCGSLGVGQTLELNLTDLVKYPHGALYDTKYTRLILHSPQLLLRTYDDRYAIYERMRLLLYLDLSDWRPAKRSDNYYGDCSFYNTESLVTYISTTNTTYIGVEIASLGRNCPNFRYFILLSTTPPALKTTDNNNLPNTWFYNKSGNVHIYVPDSAKAAYLADADWATIGGYNGSDTIANRLHGLSELPAGVWTTGLAASRYHFFNDPEVTRTLTIAYAVEDGVALTNSDISAITNIPANAFENNTLLLDFSDLNTINNCTTINDEAFKGCTNLTTIDLSNVTSIEKDAFYGCSSLTSLNFSNVTNISNYGGMLECRAFKNCSALQYAYFPILQGSPLHELFDGCTSLKLYIAPNVTNVYRPNYPFKGCTNLKGIFLPKANVGSLTTDVYHDNVIFGGLSINVIDIGNITALNEYTMKGNSSLTAFIIRNNTAIPTLTGETSSYFSNVTFYVDDSMLTAYRADSAWNNANIHLDVISNFVLANHLDSDTLALYNSIINPS